MTQLETPVQTPKLSRLQKKHLEARKNKKAKTDGAASPTLPPTPSSSGRVSVDNVEHCMEAEESVVAIERESVQNESEIIEESVVAIESEVVQNEPEIEVEEPTWMKNAGFLRQYLLRRNDTRTQTHGSFVGGKYHIPSEMIEEFHRRYLQEFRISKSPSLFLLERYSTEPFRFFVDIDYNFSDENVPAHTEVIARLRRALVGRWDSWRPDSSGYKPTMDLFPCRAACRTRWKLHTLFYNVIVDWQSAIRMGQLLQNSLDGSDEQRVVIVTGPNRRRFGGWR